MIRFGVYRPEQYLRLGDDRRLSGARVSYKLLNLPENPTPDQVRIFEDISFTLRTSNGTFRTTFRNRFCDVDDVATRLLEESHAPDESLRIEDRAVSHGLTSLEWAKTLFRKFPNAEFIASDILLYLIELSLASGDTYIVEPNGQPLQFIRPPMVLSLFEPESWRYPLNRGLAVLARLRFQRLALPEGWMDTEGGVGYRVIKIPYIHPEAHSFSKGNTRFRLRMQSIFDVTTEGSDAIRTMNIFNRSYFSQDQLNDGISAVYRSLRPGGIWIAGRTLEEDFTNHATFLQREGNGWKVLHRIGRGLEIEEMAVAWRCS